MATLRESRAGAANLGIPLMMASFVVVAGFVYWLSVTAKPTEIVVEPDIVLEGVIRFQDFSDAPGNYVDKEISLEGLPLSHPYGNHFQWINLLDPSSTGYLLYYSDSLRADTANVLPQLSEGMAVDLTGTVRAITDSVVVAWEIGGAFKSPIEATVAGATYYPNYIEVTKLQVRSTFRPAQGDGSGSG